MVLVFAMTLGVFGDVSFRVLADDYKASVGYPTADHDGLILEFADKEALERHRLVYGGEALGGNMLLVDGSYREAKQYEKTASILTVTYNYIVEATGYADIYGSDRDTQKDDPTLDEDILAFWLAAAEVADGLGDISLHTVRIAVMDTGIDATHEELSGRVAAGYDALADAEVRELAAGINSEISASSHGTMVAGLIAAKAFNGIGIAGGAGAFPVELVPIRVLNENGKGKIADIVRGIYWAIDHNIDILNMSFGARLEYYPTALAIAIKDARSQNILPIAAAGNEYGMTWQGYYPACLEGCYPVMSGTVGMGSDYTSSFSNTFPAGSVPGTDYTAICGEGLTSTVLGNAYGTFTGTSASCALITGYASVMMSLLGGRSNPAAIEAVISAFTYAHTTNTNLIRYSVVPRELDSAVTSCITAEQIGKTGSAIWGSIRCDDVLTAEETVNVLISYGEEAVGDITLVLYDTMDTIVYTSEPIEGTGTISYEIPLDTTVMADGMATIAVYCRTAEEILAQTPPAQAKCRFQRRVEIRNDLIAENARIRLYDETGMEIAATVYATDPTTGALVATLYPNEDGIVSIGRRMFRGGELTFVCVCAGIYYQKTAEFASEITLGGDEAQTSELSFAGDEVVLSGATVYTKAPSGSFVSLGVTDGEGKLSLHMSDATVSMIVMDTERKYILSVSAKQDGAQMAFSFADAVNDAKEITVSAVSALAEEDSYALTVSYEPLYNSAYGISTALLKKEENTFYLYGDSLYTMVCIYDVFYKEDAYGTRSEFSYYYTAHDLGRLDLSTMTEIDFDPTAFLTLLTVEDTELYHGENTPYSMTVRDDKGNPVIGGHQLEYITLGSPVNCGEWYGSKDYTFTDESGENDYQWFVENGIIYTCTDYGMAMPAEENTYILGAKCHIDYGVLIEYLDYTGFLSYTSAFVSESIHVLPGKTFALTLTMPEGASDIWLDTESSLVFRDGKTEKLRVLSQDYETKSYEINALGFDADTKLAVWVGVYFSEPTALGAVQYCYPAVLTYDAENTSATVEMPDTPFGVTRFTMDGNTVYDSTMTTVVDGLTLSLRGNADTAYPAGNYCTYFRGSNEKSDSVFVYQEYTNLGDTSRDIEIDSSDFRAVTVDRMDMTSVTLYPVVDGALLEWSDPYAGMLYNLSNPVLVSPRIEAVVAKFQSQHYEYMGGISWMTVLPLTENEPVFLDADGEMIASFEAYPEKLTFATTENAVLCLTATLNSGVRLQNVRQGFQAGGKSVEETELVPSVRYRKAGGEWMEKEFTDWTSIDLGKLTAGNYEAVVFVKSLDIPMVVYESAFVFVVGNAESVHTVILSAPEAVSGEVSLTVSGIGGASVTLAYTAPSGQKKIFDPFVMPQSGVYRIQIPLPEEGEYTFTAVSSLEGEEDAEAEALTVKNSFDVPAPIEGFLVTSLHDGSLKLTWQAPSGAIKLLLLRDGVALGYIPVDITTYTDHYANLNLSRTYTYTLIAENEAGRKGTPVYAQGKPTLLADTEAPTAPAALTAEASGMTVTLSWTRATDNVGVIGYRVYRDGVLIRDSVKRSYTDEGLSRDTEYVYTVTAYDGAGNESAMSTSARIVTDDTYTIDTFRVTLKTNRSGNIADDRLDMIVSVGDAERVVVKAVYLSKDMTEQIHEVELVRSGAFWTGSWIFNRVYQIVSMTAYAYEGESLVAEREADGFPRAVSAGIGVSVTVANAMYAPVAMNSAEIVLRQAETGLVFRQPIFKEADEHYYQFEHLGAGTYTLTVEYTKDGTLHELYRQDNILLANGVEKVLTPVAVNRFIRIRQDMNDLVYGISLMDTQTDDGYLLHEGDSAFFMESGMESITLISLWEGKQILVDGIFYTVPSAYDLALTEGVTLYAFDPLDGAQCQESKEIRIRFDTNEPFSLEGMEVSLRAKGDSRVHTVNASNEILLTIPVSADIVHYLIQGQSFSAENGVGYMLQGEQSWIYLEDSVEVYEIPIWLHKMTSVKLQFTCDAPMEGIKGYASIMMNSTPFVLGESGAAELTVEGYLNATMYVNIQGAFIGDYYIPQQYLSFQYESADTVYELNIKAQKQYEREIRIQFTDSHGYSLEGVAVNVFTDHSNRDFVLGADGILETTVTCYREDAHIQLSVSGQRGNLIWKKSYYTLKPEENEKEIVLSSSAEIPILGNREPYDFYLYTGEGESMEVSKLDLAYGYAFFLDNAILTQGARLVCLPRCFSSTWHDKELPVSERLAFWQEQLPDNVFELNAETITNTIRLKNVEYYTVNSLKDNVGEPIPSDSIRIYVYVGDMLVMSVVPIRGQRIPVFSEDQRMVFVGGCWETLTAEQVEEYLESYRGTYCQEWIPNESTPMARDFVFGYQSVLRFRLLDTEGQPHRDMLNTVAMFDAEQNFIYNNTLRDDLIEIPVSIAPSDFTVFLLWFYSYSNTDQYWFRLLCEYSYFDELGEQVTKYTVDPLEPHPEPIVIKANFNPVVRFTRENEDDLETNIKSVIKQEDGSYFVRMRQNGAKNFETLIVLPDGAYNVTLENTLLQEKDVPLAKGVKNAEISFFITEDALIANQRILCYALTAYGRNLQYVREVEYEIFQYGLRNSVSSNEVVFKSLGNLRNDLGMILHEDVYVYSVFSPSLYFGTSWGLNEDQVDILDPESEDYDADYDIEDYRESVGDSRGQGRWLTFDTKLKKFGVAVKVNGHSVALDSRLPFSVLRTSSGNFVAIDGMMVEAYYLERAFRSQFKTELSQSFTQYDEELDCLFYGGGFLDMYGLYDPESGYGMLPIPMAEPDIYPARYDVEIYFRYEDSEGNVQTERYDELIRMYHDAPVLQKWNYQINNLFGTTDSAVHHVTIMNREDRIDYFRNLGKRNEVYMEMFVGDYSNIFTFFAYFDKPEEVCNVYAVADIPGYSGADIEDYHINRYIRLEYDEALGCYVGSGSLGDSMHLPQAFNVVYELTAEYAYQDMLTAQLDDLFKTESMQNGGILNPENLPEGWTMEESAPENGWTLLETYMKWTTYGSILAEFAESGEVMTVEDLKPALDDDLRLYLPIYHIYNDKGEHVTSLANYYDFSDDFSPPDTNFPIALMDGTEHVGTVTQGVGVSEDGEDLYFTSSARDVSLMLPYMPSDDVSSASIGALIGKGIGFLGSKAISAGKYIHEAVQFVGPVNAAGGVLGAGFGVKDIISVSSDNALLLFGDIPEWTKDLTPKQFQDYMSYRKTGLATSAGTLSMSFGVTAMTTGIPGLITTIVIGVSGDVAKMIFGDPEEKYQKMAEINRQTRERQALMIEYLREHDHFEDMERLVWMNDPSGVIFEGIESNVLPGVTATVYYRDEGQDTWVKWDSALYGEGPNPGISDGYGHYGWDVLAGKWKVVFEKDGYYIAESEELDVPPEHMDVNISMVSKMPASLSSVKAGAQGAYLDFTFDRPVLCEDVFSMVSVLYGGEIVDGTVTALNAAETAFGNKQQHGEYDVITGQLVATAFRFTPDEPMEVGASVVLTAERGILTYNGLECESMESAYVEIPESVSDPITAIWYEGTASLSVGEKLNLFENLALSGSEGVITFKSQDENIVTVDENGVITAVGSGRTYIRMTCGDIMSAAAVLVEEAPHTHLFNVENPTLATRASAATCTAPATYYYLCECGEVGHATYSYGEPDGANHEGYALWEVTDTHHSIVYSCCGKVTMEETAHTWEDGKCVECDTLHASLEGTTVTLDGSIGLNFYFFLDDAILQNESASVLFTMEGGRTIELPVSTCKREQIGDIMLCKFPCRMYATQMSEMITAQVIMGTARSAEYQYSVVNYGQTIIDNAEGIYTEETIALVKAMLNYGAYAQTHFGYRTENLANGIVDEAERDVSFVNAEALLSYKAGGMTLDGLGTFAGSNLVLDTVTAMRVYFMPEEGVNANDLTFRLGDSVLKCVQSGEYCVITIENISSIHLDSIFTITVTDGVTEGTFTCSVYAYCYNVLNDTHGLYTEELKNVVRAMYLYNVASDIYDNSTN